MQCDHCGAHFCGACGHGEARWGTRKAHAHAMRCEYGFTTRAARLDKSGLFYQPQQCAVASARYRHGKVWARILEEGGDRYHLLYKLLEQDIEQLKREASGMGIRDVKGNIICRETAEWTNLDEFQYFSYTRRGRQRSRGLLLLSSDCLAEGSGSDLMVVQLASACSDVACM